MAWFMLERLLKKSSFSNWVKLVLRGKDSTLIISHTWYITSQNYSWLHNSWTWRHRYATVPFLNPTMQSFPDLSIFILLSKRYLKVLVLKISQPSERQLKPQRASEVYVPQVLLFLLLRNLKGSEVCLAAESMLNIYYLLTNHVCAVPFWGICSANGSLQHHWKQLVNH